MGAATDRESGKAEQLSASEDDRVQEAVAAEEKDDEKGGGGDDVGDDDITGGETVLVSAEEENEELGFDALGLDEQLLRALRKMRVVKPMPIQRKAVPLILEGRDLVAQAKTGSGKTFAYVLPLLHKLLKLASEGHVRRAAPNAFILVPTVELCEQVFGVISSLLEFFTKELKVAQVITKMLVNDMRALLSTAPNILVTTPACLLTCISKGFLRASSIKESLSTLILDEADLLLSYGYWNDLKALMPNIPRSCQCILMSATLSNDVENLTKLFLHNPVTVTLSEVGRPKDDLIPRSVQQFWISSRAEDKLLTVLALLKFELIQKKVLIFVNSIDMAFRVRLFLEKFGIKSAVLNAELPQNSRLHILKEFNAGLFDYLIATDNSQSNENEINSKNEKIDKVNKSKQRSRKHLQRALDAEFGVVRGVDFKDVFTVINFDMPRSPAGYVHRIGRTGRAHNTGVSISFVSEEEEGIFEEIKGMLRDNNDKEESECIETFPLLSKNGVESLRYRAQDVARSVTTRDVQEARRQDIKNEILNSEKLKAHFEDNPNDLDLLKHDKILSRKAIPAHLRDIPDYLIDPAIKEASKSIKVSQAAMGISKSNNRMLQNLRNRRRKGGNPDKASSAEEKNSRRGRKRRKDNDGKTTKRQRRKSNQE